MKILIKNGIVNDPANDIENEKLDILINNDKIERIAKSINAKEAKKVIDASGLYVFPGLFDMHTHLREPGQEHKENIRSGSKAAAVGGFTSIACMANTTPPNDRISQIKYQVVTSEKEAVINVYPYGAVTKGLKGESLTEMGDMLKAGAVSFSDDGATIMNAVVMRRALKYLTMFKKPIIVHAEDDDLCPVGSINEGAFSAIKGLAGIPKEAEEIIVARDIALARLTDGRVHFTHISTKGTANLIEAAKKEGLKVTSDTTPHHISLITEDVGDYNTSMKMRPPLRNDVDIKALKKAILNGTIDAIGSDHAPHSEFEKSLEFNQAPNGCIGLETSVPIILEHIIEYKEERLPIFAKIMSYNPATILGTKKGTLSVGADADITIIDLNCEFVYSKKNIVSKSKNSPFIDRKLKGKAIYTICGGKEILADARLV